MNNLTNNRMYKFDKLAFATQFCDWTYDGNIPSLAQFNFYYGTTLPVFVEIPGVGATLNNEFFKELIDGKLNV